MNDFCKTLPPSNFRRLPYFRTTDHLARSSTQELWSHGHDGQIITPENHERWNEIKPQMTGRWPRWNIICQKWHTDLIPEYRAEQGVVRRLICEGQKNETELRDCQNVVDAVTATSNCGALVEETAPADANVPVCGPKQGDGPAFPGSGANMWATLVVWGTLVMGYLVVA